MYQTFWIVVMLIFTTSFGCTAQIAPIPKSGSLQLDPVLSWTTVTWDTAADAPYHAIRMVVFNTMQQDKNPVALAQKYKAEYDTMVVKGHYYPQTAFRYAYATFQAALRDHAFRNGTA